jgi:hypothetical protein
MRKGWTKRGRHFGARQSARTRNPELFIRRAKQRRDSGFALTRAPE